MLPHHSGSTSPCAEALQMLQLSAQCLTGPQAALQGSQSSPCRSHVGDALSLGLCGVVARPRIGF